MKKLCEVKVNLYEDVDKSIFGLVEFVGLETNSDELTEIKQRYILQALYELDRISKNMTRAEQTYSSPRNNTCRESDTTSEVTPPSEPTFTFNNTSNVIWDNTPNHESFRGTIIIGTTIDEPITNNVRTAQTISEAFERITSTPRNTISWLNYNGRDNDNGR